MTTPSAHVLYTISIPDPRNHYFHVIIEINEIIGSMINLKMPTWLPGAYKLNDFARDIEEFKACDPDGKTVTWRKTDKQTWTINVPPEQALRVEYDVYAFTLEDDASYVCEEFSVFNPGASVLMVEPFAENPCQITIVLPSVWQHATTGLTRIGTGQTFFAKDYHELMDCPFMFGNHDIKTFHARGIPHELVIEGRANIDLDTFINDLQKIAEVEIDMMQHVPYQRYVFFMLLTDKDAGLEHRNSTLIFCKHHDFKPRENYILTISIFAHELFHAWNVKALRPVELIHPDYFSETYTRGLWFSEGFTNYYHYVFLRRAGVITNDEYLDTLAKLIHKYRLIPGRNFQSASDASYDAWIKYYRQDENSNNAEISYYLKGSHIALLLDIIIQTETRGQRSLDDLMRALYQNKYLEQEIGFTNDDVAKAASESCGKDLTSFFALSLDSTGDMPFEEHLGMAGIELIEKAKNGESKAHDVIPGWLGARVRELNYRVLTAFVRRDGPAQAAGLQAEDEIIAIDRFRIKTSSEFDSTLKQYPENSTITLTIARREQLKEIDVTLGRPEREGYEFKPAKESTELQALVFTGIMGSKYSDFLQKHEIKDSETVSINK